MASISAFIPPALSTAPLPPESSLANAIGVEASSSSSNHSNSTYALAPSHGEPTSTTSLPQPAPEGKTGSESFSRRYRTLERLDRACLNLAPSFFFINMGTGITSILVHDRPYNAGWLRRLGDVIFVVNVVVFILLAMGKVVRYARFKALFSAVNNHLVSGMSWGCLPMGLATIVNMVAIVCVPAWGHRWAQTALGLWWIDVVLSILVNFGMIFMMFTRHDHTIETISAAWLLPIVSSVVAAASGGVVSTALAPFDPALARSTVIVSYVVWGTGVPLAMFIITLWIYRSALSGTPASGAFCSVFLPLGPWGQGSFGIMTLGNVVRTLAYTYDVGLTVPPEGVSCSTSIQRVADAVYAGGMVTGMVLWGLGLCWYILAVAMVVDHVLKNRDFFFLSMFSVGLWAITFPIGVFATATTTLASELHSPTFKVLGTILSVQVVLHWLYVSCMTIYKACDGTIFAAPEVASFEGKVTVRWARERKSAKDDRDLEKAHNPRPSVNVP